MLRFSNSRNTLAIALLMALGTTCFAAKPPSLEEGRKHWAYQPLSKAAPPSVKNGSWPKNDVDRFILAKLEHAGLQPSPEADPATLIRRVTLDLTGLPPSPEEVAAFVHDSHASHQSYEHLIDRLLDSPHYGERWGRHWLDLARYADTSGFHNDLDRPYAWKYRDYVIRSFNEDKPYARFVAEQIAGDEIDGANEESLIATGFCRNGPSNDDNMGKNDDALAQYRADQLDDVISTTSTVFLGITIGCARCHDHKTDPLLQKDYYSLLAVFNGTELHGLVPGSQDKNDKKIKIDPAIQVHALVEKNPRVPATRVMLRGSVLNLGDEVQPAAPVVLSAQPLRFPVASDKTSLRRRALAEWITSPDNPLTWRVLANRVWQHHFGQGIVATPSNFGFTGAKPTHPELLDFLAAQLIANGGRLKPLHKLMLMSATYRQSSTVAADVRRLGIAPRPTEAASKPMSLLTSAATVDPANSLLSHMNIQRMEAEVLRDSILVVSGKLNAASGGPGIKPRLRPDLLPVSQRNKWPAIETEGAPQWRRSIYIYVKRQLLMPSMELFDAPTTTDSCALRLNSTVPTQALVLMNDEFVEDQAAFLAARATREGKDDIAKTIERLFQITLSRAPTEKRMSEALAFVRERERQSNRTAALTDLAHVLLNSSEFIYIE